MVAYTTTLDYIWLELTNVCNERCVHCYNNSGTHRKQDETLPYAGWTRVISDAASLGCPSLQFVGGEPTLVPRFGNLIAHAVSCGFEEIEIFTNATQMPDDLIDCIKRHSAHVATSLYSYDSSCHDKATRLRGSHAKTVSSLRRLLSSGVPVRVAIIDIDGDEQNVRRTVEFGKELGITRIGIDRVRGFGRGQRLVTLGPEPELTELCGECWRNKACVLPNGDLIPCVMSRTFVMGSVRRDSLPHILARPAYSRFQADVHQKVWQPLQEQKMQSDAEPYCGSCGPCNPCGPSTICCTPCGPVKKYPEN